MFSSSTFKLKCLFQTKLVSGHYLQMCLGLSVSLLFLRFFHYQILVLFRQCGLFVLAQQSGHFNVSFLLLMTEICNGVLTKQIQFRIYSMHVKLSVQISEVIFVCLMSFRYIYCLFRKIFYFHYEWETCLAVFMISNYNSRIRYVMHHFQQFDL